MKSSVACHVMDRSGTSDLALNGTLWPPVSLGFWGVCVCVWLTTARESQQYLAGEDQPRKAPKCSRGTIRTGVSEHFTYCGLGTDPDAGDFPTNHVVLPHTLSEDKHPHHPDCSPRLRIPAAAQLPWGQLHTRSRRPSQQDCG